MVPPRYELCQRVYSFSYLVYGLFEPLQSVYGCVHQFRPDTIAQEIHVGETSSTERHKKQLGGTVAAVSFRRERWREEADKNDRSVQMH
jgi:hypothetical protein